MKLSISPLRTKDGPSFSGVSERIIGFDSEKKNQAPFKSIKITDPENNDCEYSFCSDFPYREFYLDNIHQVIKNSSHYHKNSTIEQVRGLASSPAEEPPIEVSAYKVVGGSKSSSKKVGERTEAIDKKTFKTEPFECRAFHYNGNIYFADVDESVSSEIYSKHNIIVHDRKPKFAPFKDIKASYYTDAKQYDRAIIPKNSQYRDRLEAVQDYSSRKAVLLEEELKTLEPGSNQVEFKILQIKTEKKFAKSAKAILSSLDRIDQLILKRNKLEAQIKQEGADAENQAELKKTEDGIKSRFSYLGEYYKKNLPLYTESEQRTVRR